MKEDKGYSKMTDGQVVGYVILTGLYIALIGIMMIVISPLWFLALLIWNWKWNNNN